MRTPSLRHVVRCVAWGFAAFPVLAWSAPVFVTEPVDADVSTNTADETSIALNGQEEPGIAYVGKASPEVKFVRKIGAVWAGSSTTPPGAHQIHALSLAFDAQDEAHVAYEHDTGAVSTSNLRYAIFDGVAWSDGNLINDEGNVVGGGSSLAIDADGTSHLAFQYEGMGIRYGRRSAGVWTYATVDFSSTETIDLALDASGAPAVIFAAGAVRFARENAGVWSATDVTGTANVGAYLGLAFDANGNAHVCYHDASANALKYAVSGAGGSWTVEPVDSLGGTWCDIAVDDAGVPHIAYRSTTPAPGALKYARKNGSTWEIAVVDSVPAERVSIAVSGSGVPHVSYVAASTLMYAREAVPIIAVDVQDPGSGQYEWEIRADESVTAISGMFRRGGETAYRSLDPFTKQGDIWVSPVAAADVSLRGLDYYLVTEGLAGEYGDAQNPKHHAVPVGDVAGPALTSLAWRMISAPMLVDGNADTPSLLRPFFGSAGDAGWLLGRWNAGTGTYQTVGVETSLGFESGRAYWLGVTRAAAWSLPGRSAFPTQDSCFAVTLAPGWTMVGNPASYRVTLDPSRLQVDDGTTRDTFANQAAAGVVSPDVFTYSPSLTPPYELGASGLEPWEGCWIRNTTDPPAAVTLLIPAAEVVSKRSDGHAGKAAPERSLAIDAIGGDGRARVEIGLQAGATDGRDEWDIEQPPGVPDQSLLLGLVLPGSGRGAGVGELLFRDVRSPGRGVLWKLVLSNADGPTELAWSPPDARAPAGLTLIEGGRSWDMAAVRSVTLPAGRHELGILSGAGADGRAMAGLDEGLLRLSPNPLRGQAAIQFALPEAGDVRLAVYDIRGREVWRDVLHGHAAGEHALIWEARDGRDRPLASGVYFLRVESGNVLRAVRKFTVLE